MIKSALVVDHLVLRPAIQEAEIDLLRQALNEGHYLKAGRPAGHVLWQGVYRTDNETDCPELVAVLCWGGAAKRLKERDNHIGWDSVTCANRLKLIVQLRRFYVIDSARRPNLASQCLALSLRTLGGEFEARHNFHPLLAESFHDPDEHTGTLYKATNWLPLGFTKGFKRHRRDFYQDTGKPKHLRVRPLKKDAFALLARPGLLPPAPCATPCKNSPTPATPKPSAIPSAPCSPSSFTVSFAEPTTSKLSGKNAHPSIKTSAAPSA